MCCERLKIAFCWIQRPFFLQAQRFGGNESDNPHLRRQYTERARRVGATCLGAFAMAYGARAGACRRGTSALRRYDGAASGRYGAGLPATWRSLRPSSRTRDLQIACGTCRYRSCTHCNVHLAAITRGLASAIMAVAGVPSRAPSLRGWPAVVYRISGRHRARAPELTVTKLQATKSDVIGAIVTRRI
jgi:hypothetical protein